MKYQLDTEDRILRAKRGLDGFVELLAMIPGREMIEVEKIVGVLAVLTDEIDQALPGHVGVCSAND